MSNQRCAQLAGYDQSLQLLVSRVKTAVETHLDQALAACDLRVNDLLCALSRCGQRFLAEDVLAALDSLEAVFLVGGVDGNDNDSVNFRIVDQSDRVRDETDGRIRRNNFLGMSLVDVGNCSNGSAVDLVHQAQEMLGAHRAYTDNTNFQHSDYSFL